MKKLLLVIGSVLFLIIGVLIYDQIPKTQAATVLNKGTMLGKYYIEVKYNDHKLFYETENQNDYDSFSPGESVSIKVNGDKVASLSK